MSECGLRCKKTGCLLMLFFISCNIESPPKECPDRDDDGVKKPICSSQLERRFGQEGDYEQDLYDLGSLIAVWGRDYMLSTHNARENWIEQDDLIIFDGYVSMWGDHKTNEYELVVIKNYTELVPFVYKAVNSNNEWYNSDDDRVKKWSQHLVLDDGKYNNFSIAIASNDLSEEDGIYDLRFEFIHQLDTDSDVADPSVVPLGSAHRIYINQSRSDDETSLNEHSELTALNDRKSPEFWYKRKSRPYLSSCSSIEEARYIVRSHGLCLSHYVSGSDTLEDITYNYMLFEDNNLVYSFRGLASHQDDSTSEKVYNLSMQNLTPGKSYRVIAAPLFAKFYSGSLSTNIVTVVE